MKRDHRVDEGVAQVGWRITREIAKNASLRPRDYVSFKERQKRLADNRQPERIRINLGGAAKRKPKVTLAKHA